MRQIILYFCLNLITLYVDAVTETGPPGPIKIYQINDCDPPQNNLDLVATIETTNDVDSLTAEFTIPEEYGSGVLINIDADKFENNNWESSYSVEDKPLLEFLNSAIPTVWTNFRNKVEPNIETADKIPAGTYKMKNFQAAYTDLSIPQIPYGRFMLTLYLTFDDEELVCKNVELEVFKPPVA